MVSPPLASDNLILVTWPSSTGDVFAGSPNLAGDSEPAYKPESFYGATKAAAELLTAVYNDTIKIATARLYHPHGPGWKHFLINRMVQTIIEGSKVSIEGPISSISGHSPSIFSTPKKPKLNGTACNG